MSKKNLLLFSLACLNILVPSYGTDNLNILPNERLSKQVAHIRAQERLDLVINLCKKNPQFDNNTFVPELTDMLKKDLNFIRHEVDSKESAEARSSEDILKIKQELLSIEKWSEEENQKGKLTFVIYAAIGDYLSRILTVDAKRFSNVSNKSFMEFMEGNDEYSFKSNQKYFRETGMIRNVTPNFNLQPYDFSYLSSNAILISHISQKEDVLEEAVLEGLGFVPEKEIVRGLGFFGANQDSHAAFFLDVVTYPLYKLHYNPVDPMQGFLHSLGHLSSVGFMNNSCTVQDVEKMARLNQALDQKKIKDENKVYGLIYALFHDTNDSLAVSFMNIEDYRKNGLVSGKETIQAILLNRTDKKDAKEELLETLKQ